MVRITGTGEIVVNILQLWGTVKIIEQYATITEITTLTNCTNVYATAYDGTDIVNLTSDGAVLSGFVEGSFFTKNKEIAEVYSSINADRVAVDEVSVENVVGLPFTVTQKKDTDTFIRLHLTTTDNPIDFKIQIVFKYQRLSPRSKLVFL